MMDHDDFVYLVRRMRMAQTEYSGARRGRAPDSKLEALLFAAKDLELQVDINVRNHRQPTLLETEG